MTENSLGYSALDYTDTLSGFRGAERLDPSEVFELINTSKRQNYF